MEARDFRTLGRATQEALRRRALFLIEHEAMTQAEAARAVGVHRQTVNIWHKRYRERGEAGVLDGRRVSPRRGKGLLTEEEAGQARAWIIGTTPDQQGLPWGLWTRRAVRELVERRFGKRLGLSTGQLYLRRWGMIPNPADQCAGGLGGVAAGHQPKWVAALMISGMSARVRQRSPSAASRSLSVAKCLFATASSASGHRCSAGCSSGV